MHTTSKRKLVILNQASNYLTVGFANAFNEKFDEVVLITGSIHVQGEELNKSVCVHYINKWHERPASKKAFSYLLALLNMWWLLITKYRKHEVLFISVPPMGYLLNLFVPHRFSMIIWDVYPDIFKITGMSERYWLYRFWSWLNRKSFAKAHKIFTIGVKMHELIGQYINEQKPILTRIWSIFKGKERIPKEENVFIKKHQLQGKFIVQYSGNIGLTHNVEVLINIAEKLKHRKDILFQIIGRGPRRPLLETRVAERNLPNCSFLPFQSDEMFPHSLSAADIGVVTLDQKTSKGSVPSKSYNLMSYGIPSLYIASEESELNDYAIKYNHAKCFDHEALEDAARFIETLADNASVWREYAQNGIEAAKDFQRTNADRLVELYMAD